MIHRSVGGGPDDVVLFCGSGSTGAIDKLVELLGLRIPAALDDRYGLRSAMIPAAERPVVFIGPYEHHSNELPWRESIADVVTILEDADGRVDLAHLEEELERYAGRPLKIGSFSAASNVTGIVTDVERVATPAAPPRRAQLLGLRSRRPASADRDEPGRRSSPTRTPSSSRRTSSSAGRARPECSWPSARCFRNRVPAVPGGGTISFVSPARPLVPPGTRGARGGRDAGDRRVDPRRPRVRPQGRRRRQRDPAARGARSSAGHSRRGARTRGSRCSATELSTGSRIVSLGLRHPRGLLHSHFVGAVLNDLFGIQVRSGCFCAGPYLHRLLPIGEGWSRECTPRSWTATRARSSRSCASASATS